MGSARVEERVADATGGRLPPGVAARLSRYLLVLIQARKAGRQTISSRELSEYAHVNSTQIRRDLSSLGRWGKRGVGYDTARLAGGIREVLHTAGQHGIVLVGAGNLGQAIAAADIFDDHGFRIVAVFDSDPRKVGRPVGGAANGAGALAVRSVDEMGDVVKESQVLVGVLAVPSQAAQGAADSLIEAGVKIVFNYSDALIEAPAGVVVHTSSPAVDLLYALYFYLA